VTVPEPPGGRRPATGMDPMPGSTPFPGGPADVVGDPLRPGGRPGPDEVPRPDGRLTVVATGRDDRRRHVVEIESGEFGDPTGLRARCGAAVEQVVPGLGADRADCPGCRLDVLR
jgi:hypothetical protein